MAGRVGRTERSCQQIRNAFQYYLSPTVVEELVTNPESLRRGGRRREITEFFSDVVGFATISEQLDPADLTTLLNEYLGGMIDPAGRTVALEVATDVRSFGTSSTCQKFQSSHCSPTAPAPTRREGPAVRDAPGAQNHS